MIFGLDDGAAAVWVATIAAAAAIVGPIVVGIFGARIRGTVRQEAEATREQNSSQHGEGQRLVETVASSLLELHGKVDALDRKVDVVVTDVETLTSRVDNLDGG